MAPRSPATVTTPVRALGAAVHDLTTERHEPDKSRGLRPDLWGTAGEIPAVYPALNNPVLRTEGRVTPIDVVLAVAVLAGLVGNAAFGWWWADPFAGSVLVFYALREARVIFTGQH